MRTNTLPIESALPALREALEASRGAVLIAEPGAGKTTRVPLALLAERWLQGQRIVMLEPRRLAARSAARYMAAELGETVGETVGYRVRMDTKVGSRTRIEVVTEGVLTRMLQADPALEGIGLVIFDEFHERSLQADLGLALALQSQSLLREELRLLVMSATLEAEPVARLLGDAPVVVSEGRTYPVRTAYRPVPAAATAGWGAFGAIEDAAARAVLEALREESGDVLVFLPGMREIRMAERKLRERLTGTGASPVAICPLHGSLPQEAQERAIAPARPGERKVVLSTSVAETSLTVEGVTAVVDCGLMRVSRFSPRTGMSRLETVTVSAASADQRRGRAGRVAPGACYRLWSEEAQRQLAPRANPEILETDLAQLVLELSAWGVADPAELAWLDAPPAPALKQAQELLAQLGALSPEGGITPHGRRMAAFGLHPRLSHMLLCAEPLGLGAAACRLAILLGERDAYRPAGGSPDTDIRSRMAALDGGRGAAGWEEATRRRLLEEAERLQRTLGSAADGADARKRGSARDEADACGLLLAFAYPDRIARRREGGKYLLSGGRGAELPSGDPLAREEWIVAAELDDAGADSRVRLAAPVALAELEERFAEAFRTETLVYWDPDAQAVRARVRKRLGALLLDESPLPNPSPDRVKGALLAAIAESRLELLPWTKAARQLQERVMFLHRHDASWPDWSDEALAETLADWLSPFVDRMRSRSDLQKLILKDALEAGLPWNSRRLLDEEAPTHWAVPSGSRIPIDYSDPGAPALAVRLQELFGLPETPRIGGGKVPLTLHLLSPAQRPVQVTRDLASFWRDAYFEVRKDLKGRYPKHYWPDHPLDAEATRRAKPRT